MAAKVRKAPLPPKGDWQPHLTSPRGRTANARWLAYARSFLCAMLFRTLTCATQRKMSRNPVAGKIKRGFGSEECQRIRCIVQKQGLCPANPPLGDRGGLRHFYVVSRVFIFVFLFLLLFFERGSSFFHFHVLDPNGITAGPDE